MSLDERKALECKGNLRQFVQSFQGPEPIAKERAGLEPICPAAGKPTFMESLNAADGKPSDQLVVTCAGGNHVLAGFSEDYPRWEAGKGLVDNSEGKVSVPSAFQLPLPEDAKIIESYAHQGMIYVSFTTEQNLEELGASYHKLLNPGTELVLAVNNGVLGFDGAIDGISYKVTLLMEKKTVEVGFDPLTIAK